MEEYFSFNQKVLASIGINLDENEKKHEKPLRLVSLLAVILSSLQSAMFLMKSTHFDFRIASAFTIGLYSVQGSFKIVAVLWNIGKLKKLKKTLNELMEETSAFKKDENVQELQKFRKTTKMCLLTNVSCIWMFLIKPFFSMIFFLITKGFVSKTLPFSFFYPFEVFTNGRYFPVYIYEVAFGHLLTIVPQAMDGIIFLMVGQIIVLFKCVGDKFETVISHCHATEPSRNLDKLKDVISLHNKVFNLSEELFRIYEIPLLANVLLQTGTVCFITFIISVTKSSSESYTFLLICLSQTQTADIMIPSLFGLFNSMAQLLLICWFGEKVKESVRNQVFFIRKQTELPFLFRA